MTSFASSDDLVAAFAGRADLSVTISTFDVSQGLLNVADSLV